MARPVTMIDFSVFKPPEEYKLNHDAGIVNAAKWSVSVVVNWLVLRPIGCCGAVVGVRASQGAPTCAQEACLCWIHAQQNIWWRSGREQRRTTVLTHAATQPSVVLQLSAPARSNLNSRHALPDCAVVVCRCM